MKHPDSGYVQGINDLVIPFFQVFLSAYISKFATSLTVPASTGPDTRTITREDRDPESFDVSLLPEHALSAIEADCFWCLEKMLSGIPDYYIHGQPGIMRSVKKMTELVARIDRE